MEDPKQPPDEEQETTELPEAASTGTVAPDDPNAPTTTESPEQ